MSADAVLAQLDTVLNRLQEAMAWSNGNLGNLPRAAQVQQQTQLFAAVKRLAPVGSVYRQEAAHAINRRSAVPYTVNELEGIVRSLRADYEAGYMATVEELIHADLFADFLEMAKELLDKKFKDAAAVIIGSVLEEHLRQLAARQDIPTAVGGRAVKADKLNSDLAKAGVYNKLELKTVTAWLDLRNNAAHGRYGEYGEAQVQQMLDGVRDFTVRHPA